MALIKISLVLLAVISVCLASEDFHFKCGEGEGEDGGMFRPMLPVDKTEDQAEEGPPPFRLFVSKTTISAGENITGKMASILCLGQIIDY